MRWVRGAVGGFVAGTLGVAAIGFALPAMVSGEPPALAFLVAALSGVPSVGIGVALLWLRPHNRIGLLLALAGLIAVGLAAADNYLSVAQQLTTNDAGSLPVSAVAVALLQGSWMLYYLPWAWLLLLFPSGRLVHRTDRWLAAALPAIVVLFSVLAALGPVDSAPPEVARDGLIPGADLVAVVLLPLFLAVLVACAVRFKLRYRRAPVAERLQMRWLAAAGVLIPATLVLCWASYLLLRTSDVVMVGLVLIYVMLPAAVAVAVFRAELFDVDRVMANGLVATGLGVVALSVLAAVAGIAGVMIGHESVGLTAAVTAVLLLVMVPVHKRLIRWVDRRLYPTRWQALAAMAALDRDVQVGAAPPEALEGRLRGALGRPGLRLGYLLPGSGVMVNSRCEPVHLGSRAITVVVAGHPVGLIDYGRDPGNEHASGLILDQEVLAVVARSMVPVSLRLELAQALDEVAASRSRILAASYVERQRLERDLHDGAQQRLVALGMALRLAQRHLGTEQQQLHGVLDGAVSELGTVVAEIRQLAHGVRPSSLNAGLPAALEQLCQTAPFPIELQLGRTQGHTIPELVSTTAYFVASEAVANAAKYAQASKIAVTLDHDGATVRLGVTDNGGGGAVLRKGGGLAGLLDRVRDQGGTMNVVSQVGHGTLVEVALPCV